MIDIHCHILPGADDGSASMEDSLMMARMAVAGGVNTVIATPHCNLPYVDDPNYISDRLRDRYIELISALRDEKIPLKILPGAEVMATPDLAELIENKRVLTLAGSRYLLTEFFFGEDEEYITGMLGKVIEAGLRPIVAHPERYRAVHRRPEVVEEWVQEGCIIQLNKGSILGHFGRRVKMASEWILCRGLAHIVASDAHGCEQRTPHMAEISAVLERAYGASTARLLLEENPRRIINDEERILLP